MLLESFGLFLLGRVGRQVFRETVARAKEGDARRRLVSGLAEAAEVALGRAEQDLGDDSVSVPAALPLRVGEALAQCAAAASGGRRDQERGHGVELSKERATALLEPFAKVLRVDARLGLADEMAAAYCEYATEVAPWAEDATPAMHPLLARFFVSFARRFQDEVLARFPDETTAAARARLERGVAAVAEAVQASGLGVEAALGRQTQLIVEQIQAMAAGDLAVLGRPLDDAAVLREKAREYASSLLAADSAQLYHRILAVLGDPTLGHRLPRVGQVYVVSSVHPRLGGSRAGEERQAGLESRAGREAPADEPGHLDEADGPGLLRYLGDRCAGLTGAPGSGKSLELRAVEAHLARRLEAGTGSIVPHYLRLRRSWPGLGKELLRLAEPHRGVLASALHGRDGLSLLLLVDSFDEADDEVCREVCRVLARLLSAAPRVAVVVAGRAEAVEHWTVLASHLHRVVEVQPFSRDQQAQLVNGFCGAVTPSVGHDAVERIRSLALGRIGRDDGLGRMLASPLYLTVYLAVAAFEGGTPPEDAAGVLRVFSRRMIRAALDERHGPDVARLATEPFAALLERLASSGDWLSAGTPQPFVQDDLLQLASTDPALKRAAGALRTTSPEQIAGEALTGCGLFEKRDDDGRSVWTFALYPFQEHFAARGLARRLDKGSDEEIDGFVGELCRARWTEELPRHLAEVIARDRQIGLAAVERRAELLRRLQGRLSRALHGDPFPAGSLDLLLALRDELVERDDELERWAVREADRLVPEMARQEPVWTQLGGQGLPVDPFMVVAWAEERAAIERQMRVVLDEAGAEAPDPGALEELLWSQEPGRPWRVERRGCSYEATVAGESWLLVPAGRFLAGDVAYSAERPVRVERAGAFWVARDPVTVGEFKAFVEHGYRLKDECWSTFRDAAERGLRGRRYPYRWEDGKPDLPDDAPVVGVSWFEAAAYCRWLSLRATADQRADLYRLPSEAEWEKAARGLFGRRWPWGCAWRAGLVVCGDKAGRERPGAAAENLNVSPFGAQGMAGNVWEWTKTHWEAAKFGEEVESPGYGDRISMRGGSFVYGRHGVRCAYRVRLHAWFGIGVVIGFRCVRDVR